jgi:hypothetical protein
VLEVNGLQLPLVEEFVPQQVRLSRGLTHAPPACAGRGRPWLDNAPDGTIVVGEDIRKNGEWHPL